MAFLDNSGDIILDAVLTDLGRNRLARGDGSFIIAHFALGDDEINYAEYRNSNHVNGAHLSGSPYYDLNILQTPILEGFTNNASVLKHKLLKIPRTDHLYLPVTRLNEKLPATARNSNAQQASGRFVIGVDTTTNQNYDGVDNRQGIFENNNGFMDGVFGGGSIIQLDQGWDTGDKSPQEELPLDLKETLYTVQLDSRLGTIAPPTARRGRGGLTPLARSFTDDDHISYFNVSVGDDTGLVSRISERGLITATNEIIQGPRGTRLAFSVRAGVRLQDSNQLFEQLGTLNANWVRSDSKGTATVHYIDTNIRVTGNDTGYSVDIPVRFVKQISC